jgi:hypothetical protein
METQSQIEAKLKEFHSNRNKAMEEEDYATGQYWGGRIDELERVRRQGYGVPDPQTLGLAIDQQSMRKRRERR